MKRRNFLQNSLCALGAAGASATLGGLNRIAAATSPTAMQSDYKALVCVFLYGGNDGDNTLIPRSQTDYNAYAATRRILAVPRDQLLPITPMATDGRDWGFHPSWPGMQALFAQKKLAVVANTGILLAPTTRDQIIRESVPLPPQLFSHADQQAHWHTSWSDQIPKTGWGGRLADIVNAQNPNAQVSMSISLAGSNLFEVGSQVFPYMISPEGVISLWYYNETWGNPETVVTKTMLDAQYANLFEKTYSETFKRAIENEKKISGILQSAPALTTVFPADNDLASQLKMVARLISVRAALGVRRQIFFCDMQGFDTHGEQPTTHAGLLQQLSQAMKAFYDATVELGVANNVTTFTQSDFGRTYKTNGKGSDHGWGNHQFVMGGAVKGGAIYGQIPVHQINGPNDTSDGRWIPTIASDEYASTLALWFGVGASDLPSVLPNINRFNRINLGFMA
ncbi:MAG: DUF1501 domain-containing protein [Acidobacteria bacterium]|nr:DUF1501 domain-containing protein [Acidobacteriota bacterium]